MCQLWRDYPGTPLKSLQVNWLIYGIEGGGEVRNPGARRHELRVPDADSTENNRIDEGCLT